MQTKRRTELWFGDEHSFNERKRKIVEANETGRGYAVVRCLQQVHSDKKAAVDLHIKAYSNCMDCILGQYMLGSTKVFYRGYVPCDVLYIGEAPKLEEKTHTIPFIGEEGKVLDRIIVETHFRLSERQRDNCIRWCICNSVLCIPFEKGELRNPHKDELKACSRRLQAFINLCQPKLIIQVGMIAQDAMRLFDCSVPQIYIPSPAWMMKQKSDQELFEKKAYLYTSTTIQKMVETNTIQLIGE